MMVCEHQELSIALETGFVVFKQNVALKMFSFAYILIIFTEHITMFNY